MYIDKYLQVYRVALEKDGHSSQFPFPGLDIGRFLDDITGLLPTHKHKHKHKHKIAPTTAKSVVEAPKETHTGTTKNGSFMAYGPTQ